MTARASDAAPDIEEFDEFVTRHPELVTVDFFIIDVNGNALGKRLPVREARQAFLNGVAFSACSPLLDVRGRGHNPCGIGNSDGDPDAIAMPVKGTLKATPWTPEPNAQVLCSMRDVTSLAPLWFDPREILRDITRRCADGGIFPVLACELEFYLIDRQRTKSGRPKVAAGLQTGQPPRRPAALSMDELDNSNVLISTIRRAAEAQSIPVSGIVAEYGVGQYEVNLTHVSDPLLAADHAVLLRRLVKGAARSLGVEATFMAKPFAEQPGNGLHVHISLVDEFGHNRFGAPEGELLLENAIAGMQALLSDCVGVFAPSFNSYRRLTASGIPKAATWGLNNRSVAFRVPTGSPEQRRIEHRLAGADASPHLTVAAILAAVLHGITHQLRPTSPPVTGRAPSDGNPSLPDNLISALDCLRRSELLSQYIPQRYLEAYVQLKRGEYRALTEQIFRQELDFYV